MPVINERFVSINDYPLFVKEGKRPDGRKFDEFREVRMSTNYLTTVPGSAIVSIGSTKVVAAVSLSTSKADTISGSGIRLVDVNVSVPDRIPTVPRLSKSTPFGLLLASHLSDIFNLPDVIDKAVFEPANYVDDGSIKVSDTKRRLVVDVQCLSFDGNLWDSATLAVSAALFTALFPDSSSPSSGAKQRLKLKLFPVSSAFAVVNGDYTGRTTEVQESGTIGSNQSVLVVADPSHSNMEDSLGRSARIERSSISSGIMDVSIGSVVITHGIILSNGILSGTDQSGSSSILGMKILGDVGDSIDMKELLSLSRTHSTSISKLVGELSV